MFKWIKLITSPLGGVITKLLLVVCLSGFLFWVIKSAVNKYDNLTRLNAELISQSKQNKIELKKTSNELNKLKKNFNSFNKSLIESNSKIRKLSNENKEIRDFLNIPVPDKLRDVLNNN